MKITEVIKELEKYKKKFGDIEVVVCDMMGEFAPVKYFNYEENELGYFEKEYLLLS